MNLSGKKLLVLGGTNASWDVVKEAKKLGAHVTIADREPVTIGVTKKMADEVYQIDTTDIPGLTRLIREKQIDGAFCGPSEFNIRNLIALCEKAGLPCYATMEQWDTCANKATFKELCRRFDVPCVPQFHLTTELRREDLDRLNYPVILKPVDGSSSAGLFVCRNEAEVIEAVPRSAAASKSGEIIAEKCILSDCGFGCRYIANQGEIYLSAVNDRYTVDTPGGKALISSAAIFPSKRIDEFINEINPNVIRMFKSLGIQNGTMFMQALIDQDDGRICFHEMGLRLSGGLIFSMLEAACGYNDLHMMLRFALGGEMATPEEIGRIDPYMHGHFIGSLTIPLKAGTIGTIEGIDEIKADPAVLDLVQYYQVGDVLEERLIGTLAQHFCRVKLITDSVEAFKEKIDRVQSMIKVRDVNGENMIYKQFDVNRMQ